MQKDLPQSKEEVNGVGAILELEQKNLESKILTVRGTEDGLVFRIDGKGDWQEIISEVDIFLGGKKKFFDGGHVSLEWVDRLPTAEQTKQLEEHLLSLYGLEIATKRKKPSKLFVAVNKDALVPESLTEELSDNQNQANLNQAADLSNLSSSAKFAHSNLATAAINLFNDHSTSSRNEVNFSEPETLAEEVQVVRPANFSNSSGLDNVATSAAGSSAVARRRFPSRLGRGSSDEIFMEEDANARVHFGTLRSGQKIETPFSLIVIGDVNPGADLIAGGDIIILGALKGTAHASAYDDDAFDRVIVALQMQPMQLRIGSVISRGSEERVRGVEIARIENRRIVVQAYNPRGVYGKR